MMMRNMKPRHSVIKCLFHGTSSLYLEHILRDGLVPEASYKGYLCYADELDISRHHANFMAEWEQSDPVIFSIPIEKFDPEYFCLEENFIELGPSSGRAQGTDLRHRSWTWKELLDIAGAVGYSKVVKVDKENIL